jgi:hypothetical protein
MKIDSNGYTQANEKAIKNSNIKQENPSKEEKKELTVEEQINKSAIEVSLSMNAQIILFTMNSGDTASKNIEAQTNILDFLSGKEVKGQLSLKNIGYEGKPITELSKEEASSLIDENGFFGVDQTSKRVSDFVLNFADNDLDILEKGREGIVQGFEDAKKMWGNELPQISYDTQTKTLELIDAKIKELKNPDNKDS